VTNAGITVSGLNEFRRKLKDMDGALPKQLRMVLNESADVIVGDARPRVPRRSGRAQGTVRARSTQSKARVTGGGRKAPYYPWLDFGGRIPRGPRRPFLTRGRFIYHAYFSHRDEFRGRMQDGIIKLARDAGVEIS
jgi:hypothetical protein